MTKPKTQFLIDTQTLAPDFSIPLARVGVAKVSHMFLIKGQPVMTEVLLQASLEARAKGVHMSRFYENLTDILGERDEALTLPQLAINLGQAVIETQEVEQSFVQITAMLPFEKLSPVTGAKTLEINKVVIEAESLTSSTFPGVVTRGSVSVMVEGITACPCAQGMVKEWTMDRLEEKGFTPRDIRTIIETIPGATHNQRSEGTLTLFYDDLTEADLDLMVSIIEESMSSPVRHLLKRPDELALVLQAHANPRFVEDVARYMLWSAYQNCQFHSSLTEVAVRQVNYESIHKHNAIAEVRMPLASLASYINGGN